LEKDSAKIEEMTTREKGEDISWKVLIPTTISAQNYWKIYQFCQSLTTMVEGFWKDCGGLYKFFRSFKNKTVGKNLWGLGLNPLLSY
jgi:hypothetical protein